jgi:hypothetical protein
MRTHDEIIQRIKERKDEDWFGFEWPYYLEVLPFDKAMQFLKKDAAADGWVVKTEQQIKEAAIDYMPFAWGKANNCRGISAGRSISHYTAWLWLLGVPWADELLEEYEYYGKPQLERICEYLGLDSKKWDDGIRSNDEY